MIRAGTDVEWDWGQGTAKGVVQEKATNKVERTIDGEMITRLGSADNPALVIEQQDGTIVLKLESEVRRVHAP